ncbi:fimbrial protein [Enterobacter cancerogenus]|uniref:fimbrial protein n=1 Tax=Enterobacter cancerogenus TaxID=69218 RepID=UPI00235E766A|nr:fimbrial protein [Enterobacter cancerogenus]
MKQNKTILAASIVMAMLSFSSHAAEQGHGTVTFTGAIIDAPCSINPDSIDQTINLGQIASAALKDGGTSTPRQFQIKLENCSTATAKTVKTTFTGAAGADGRLGIDGTAKGASIAITDGKGKLIKLGEATDAQTIQDGNNNIEFAAYLQGDGKDGDGKDTTIVPGDFHSITNFTLAYQ